MRCVGRVEDEDYAAHLDAYLAILETRQRFGVIVDARRAMPLPSSQRRMQSAFLDRHRDTFAAHCAGEVFVIDGPLVRAALKAVLFFSPLPHPHAVVGTVEDAELVAVQLLGAAATERR